MLILLPLVAIFFSGVVVVDAGRLGQTLDHPRLLQSKVVETEHQSSGDQLGSERDILDEDDTPGSSESEHVDGFLDAKGQKSVETDPTSASSEAVRGSDSIQETPEEMEKGTQIEQGRENPRNPSTITNQKGNNNLDNSGSSNNSFEASSLNEHTFTELEVEDMTTIVQEGDLFRGSRGLVFCILLGVCASIFTAGQVADSPDGAYASLCRWTVSTLALFFRILLFPLSMCCNWNNHEHVPLARTDYGYKDPSLEFS